jgi:hypothetical protein
MLSQIQLVGYPVKRRLLLFKSASVHTFPWAVVPTDANSQLMFQNQLPWELASAAMCLAEIASQLTARGCIISGLLG